MISRSEELYIEMIEGLHAKWTPHPGQVKMGRALFDQGKDVFGQNGRNWGKTDLQCYSLWRWAKANPKSENYYFAPFAKQAGEILWEGRRIQDFGPESWIDGKPNETEMRITFKNGSFIKLDGSDNYHAYRGVKPKGLTIFDEFKDFQPEFYGAYDPNRAAYKAPLMIFGTPPERECQFLEVAEEFRTNPDKYFHQAAWSENPHLDAKWHLDKKNELIKKGEEDVWQREYEGIYVPGGISKVFPMLTKDLVIPHEEMMQTIMKDRKKLEFFAVADPGAATVFGVLFLALNPYTKVWYAFDEIYETEQAKMSVKQIGQEIRNKMNVLNDGRIEWRKVYDEAATWFKNEMYDNFHEYWEPTQKSLRKKEVGISITRDILLKKNVLISDKCQKFYWEMDNYYKDKNGQIPKKHDHLIDTWRYGLDAAYYELKEETEYEEKLDPDFRGARISHDYPMLDDWGDRVSEGDFDG